VQGPHGLLVVPHITPPAVGIVTDFESRLLGGVVGDPALPAHHARSHVEVSGGKARLPEILGFDDVIVD
jgi:hypothetical protein